MPHRILIVIYGPSDGTEMVRVAAALRHRFDVSVHFDGIWPTIENRLDWRQLSAIPLSDLNGPVVAGASAQGPARQAADVSIGGMRRFIRALPAPVRAALRQFWRFVLRARAAALKNLPGEMLKLRRDLAAADRLLDEKSPDLLILPLESVGHMSATLAFVARRRQIPVLIVPYTIPVTVAEIAERWLHDKTYWRSAWRNRPAGFMAPQWVTRYRNRDLLRLRPREIFARWLFGLSPKNPWDGGGLQFADAIAIENDAMLAIYRRERFPEAKLHVTGAVADDTLARAFRDRDRLRRDLFREMGFDPNKPLVLTAIPPDFVSRAECPFDSYEELVKFWMTALGGLKSFNVLARLHPSLDPGNFAFLEQRNFRLASQDTALLIPLSDLFVASVSSTIRWAIACGVPTLNYDVYRFGYEDYSGVPGVLPVDTKAAFTAALERLESDKSYFAHIRTLQEGSRHQWSQGDVSAGDRLVALAGLLLDAKSVAKAGRDR